jgi:hypothetical protein
MLIYSHIITPRVEYAFRVIFGHVLGLPYQLTTNEQAFLASNNPKIAYCKDRRGDAFFIASHDLLFDTGINARPSDFFAWEGLPAFLKTDGDIPFDMVAATFYLVTRYEEYFGHDTDKFGRFRAKDSLAWKFGFLDRPVVNLWALELSAKLKTRFPGLTFPKRSFKPLVTFDIDVVYAYRGRTLKRSALAIFNDLVHGRTDKLQERISCLKGKIPDPYDTYDYIRQSIDRHKTELLFFFLLSAKNNRYDRNLMPASPEVSNLITALSDDADSGIHPSYYSSEQPELIAREKDLLEKISKRKITKSRQHYLRFKLPDTFSALEAAGITDDYSLGFADLPGFRASICSPFLFYNLHEERISSLTLHPVTCMDGTFIEDMQLSPDEALLFIKKLIAAVQAVDGEFTAIWHNHTVSESGVYKGWRSVYEATLDHLNARAS